MNEQEIKDVDEEKDLGVMFSSDLKVTAQCKAISEAIVFWV